MHYSDSNSFIVMKHISILWIVLIGISCGLVNTKYQGSSVFANGYTQRNTQLNNQRPRSHKKPKPDLKQKFQSIEDSMFIRRLPPIFLPSQIPPAVSLFPKIPVKKDTIVLGHITLGLSNEYFVINARINDKDIQINKANPGSSSHIGFFFPVKTDDTIQVKKIYLIPGASNSEATGLFNTKNDEYKEIQEINMISSLTQSGYHLQALVPLSYTNIDPSQESFKMEINLKSHPSEAEQSLNVNVFGVNDIYKDYKKYGTTIIK